MKTTKTFDYELENLRNTKPILDFDGSIPLSEWKPKAKEKLLELLGLPLEKCEPDFEIEYKKELSDFTEFRFTVQTEPGYYVPCHLLIPKGVAAPVPLTIDLMGHGSGMHIALGRAKTESDEKNIKEWPHRAMALRAISEKRCALVIESRSFGEASVNGYGTSCTEAAKIAIIMGRTTIGERVWDVMRVLDMVKEHFPEVDMRGIVCTGNSGGGTATYYLAAVDERIAFAAPCCSVCTYEDSIAPIEHCLCNHIPSIRKYFEMGDLAGFIAPRKLIVAAGEKDTIFPIEGVKKAYKQIEFIYKSANCPQNCALVVGEKGHFNYADQIWETLHKMGI